MRCRCSAVILLMDDRPVFYVGPALPRSRGAELPDAREFDLASRAWVHERRLLVEQASLAMLAMFGFARHFGLPPVLIRAGESLGAHRPPCASSARCGVENAAGR